VRRMNENETALTVGAVARRAGVTVRTMHHYDELGLVVPGERSDSGYRLYGRREVERLQEVLFFRELGFGLDEIKEIVDRPGYDRTDVLRRQRDLLMAKADRLLAMVDAVDIALEAGRTGMNLTEEEMLEVFGDHDPTEHQREAAERWGDTEAYRESARRVARFTKDDWMELGREAADINDAFIALMAAEAPADGEEAMAVAERHRVHISKWFYECSVEIHAGLGEMYVADPRFTANIDKAAPGLAAYMSKAMQANAMRP
jgi:MerR family transcriptional regulator, thiopeptide resistance regulator